MNRRATYVGPLEHLRGKAEPLLPPHTMSASMLAVPENLRKYVREYAEAYARSAQAAAQGWLPIESAPKDTEILVGPTKRMGICVAMNHTRDGWVTETPSEWVSIYTPTHWQPLPPPPQNLIAGK